MKKEDIKIGKWYRIDKYGSDYDIKGKVICIRNDIVTMRFYWGLPWRTKEPVDINRIVGECKKPSLFSN